MTNKQLLASWFAECAMRNPLPHNQHFSEARFCVADRQCKAYKELVRTPSYINITYPGVPKCTWV